MPQANPKNILVKYIGPKKQMYVPFPADNKLPLASVSELDEIVTFPRNVPVELPPARAAALLERSPDVFKAWGEIKPAVKPAAKVEKVEGEVEPLVLIPGKAETIKKPVDPNHVPVVSELTEAEFNNV